MRSDWHLPLCTGAERIKGADGKKAHPTQKPENLLARVILSSTKRGDIVLDPFFGTGTTGAVAKKLGRHFIGIEQDANYVKVATSRIAAVTPVADTHLLDTKTKKAEPRVPFGALVERGWISVGDKIFDQKRRFSAQVCADGTLKAVKKFKGKDATGTIHTLGAQLQEAPSCNGWTFWHIERDGKDVVIDELRTKLRQENYSA